MERSFLWTHRKLISTIFFSLKREKKNHAEVFNREGNPFQHMQPPLEGRGPSADVFCHQLHLAVSTWTLLSTDSTSKGKWVSTKLLYLKALSASPWRLSSGKLGESHVSRQGTSQSKSKGTLGLQGLCLQREPMASEPRRLWQMVLTFPGSREQSLRPCDYLDGSHSGSGPFLKLLTCLNT